MNKPLFPDVVVNGQSISAADIAAEAQNHHAPQGKPGLAWRRAARALVVRHLLLEQARAMGLNAAPLQVAPGKFETGDEALIRVVLEHKVNPDPVKVSDLQAAYDADPDRFRAPSLYEAAHILFAAEPGDDVARAQARKLAEQALQTLARSPEKFGDIARRESACSSREAGGVLGQLSSGDTVPEFEAAMARAPEGEIWSTPVETRYGVHVLRVDARAEGAVLPFSSVKNRLAEAAEKANWTRAAHAYVGDLLAGADVQGVSTLLSA